MDTGTVIISVILIAVVLLPFIFTGKKYRKQKKQLVNGLNSLAEQNQVKLGSHEVSGNFGIGSDQDFAYLFFARMVQGEIYTRTVLLAEMSRCKLRTSSRLLGHEEKVLDRVELVLSPVSAAQPEMVLEMYNSEYDTLTIRGELQVALKWEQTIAAALNDIKQKVRKKTPSKPVEIT